MWHGQRTEHILARQQEDRHTCLALRSGAVSAVNAALVKSVEGTDKLKNTC